MMRNYNPKCSILFGRMRRLLIGFSLLGLATLSLTTATLLLAQQQPAKQGLPTPVTAAPATSDANSDEIAKFAVGTRYVQAPVTVLDREGHVVNGLNALDFQLFDDGRPQQISEDLSEHPISLVVA